MSLYEMKKLCTSNPFDIEQFVSILEKRNFLTNEEMLDYLTQQIVEIFENRRKFSYEKCEELKSLIEKKTFGKQRCRLINESFEKHRSRRNILPLIDPTILNQLLTKILEKDHQVKHKRATYYSYHPFRVFLGSFAILHSVRRIFATHRF